MERETLSVVILTKNEEEYIRDCLESVKWADEIIVVDSGSTDATVDICREYTDKIYFREFDGFGPQKNFAISKATCDWILYLAADTRVTPELRREIEERVLKRRGEGCNGFRFPLIDIYRGRMLRFGGFRQHHPLLLFRRGKGRFEMRLRHVGTIVEGKVGRLKSPLIHVFRTNYLEYLRRSLDYGPLEAKQDLWEGKRSTAFHIFFIPLWRFVARFFFKLGFLDGIPGLLFCLGRAFQDFVEFAALWEMQQEGKKEKPFEQFEFRRKRF